MTHSDTDLFAELDNLRQRFKQMESQLASPRHRLLTGLALLLAVALCGIAASDGRHWRAFAQGGGGPLPPAGPIVCNSLKIVNPAGKEQVSLGHDAISGFVKINGPDGKLRAALWTDDKSQFGQLNLMDELGKTRVALAGSPEGGGANFYSKDGKLHAYIGSARDGDRGALDLIGPQGKSVVQLGSDAEGGYVWVNSQAGQPRASLWVAKGGKNGLLNLHNENGKTRATLGIDQHGGVVDLFGNNDKAQVSLDCDTKIGGALRLFTPQKVQLFYVGGNTNSGEGHVQLSGTDGVTRLDLFVNANDEGMIWGANAANQVVRWLK